MGAALDPSSMMFPAAGRGRPLTAHDLDNDYLEGHAHCDQPGAAGCFLTEVSRSRVVNAVQAEISDAKMAYGDALLQMSFEKLVAKEEQAEVPIIITFALDALSAHLFSSLSGIAMELRSAPPAKMAEGLEGMLALQAGEVLDPRAGLATEVIRSIPEEHVGAAIRSGVELGKGKLKKQSGRADDQKAVSLSYLDELRGKADIAFQHFRQDIPAKSTDADLIVAFHMFQAENGHTMADYKRALEEKLARFLESPASEIGRKMEHSEKHEKHPYSDSTMRDTKVAWVSTKAHPDAVLYYIKQDFAWHAYNTDAERVPGAPTGHHALDDGFVPYKPVEAEFIDTAIAKHRAVWNADPEHLVVDPSEIVRDVSDLSQFVPQYNPFLEHQDVASHVADKVHAAPMWDDDAHLAGMGK